MHALSYVYKGIYLVDRDHYDVYLRLTRFLFVLHVINRETAQNLMSKFKPFIV